MDIREKTEKKVFAYIEEHSMLDPHDKVVLGVSGGADSVCLFRLLISYTGRIPISLGVVHVNHGIRPDAGEDARYVEELCRKSGIPFFLTEADVRGLARKEKCSEEDAGRRVRYEAFARAAKALGGAKVAVAHNSNDNAETMLFHLFRGSGLKGLGGITPVGREPVSGNSIIRPILCLERREVEAYLKAWGLEWREDSTNAGDDYSRNRIRHHILPYAEQELFEGAVEHMSRTSQLLQETEKYLDQQTRGALAECARADGALLPGHIRYVVEAGKFGNFHEVLQKRMLLSLAKELSPTGKDIGWVHIRNILSLFERQENRSINLPFGIRAWRQYGKVVLERREDAICSKEVPCRETVPNQKSAPFQEIVLREVTTVKIFQIPLVYELGKAVWEEFSGVTCQELFSRQTDTAGEGRVKMEFSLFPAKKDQEVPRNRYTKWFDYDKIKKCMMIRTRRQGDYLTITDGKGNMIHKSLKNYMITEKIPRQLRDSIPLLAEGSHVLWLVGWRISEHFKVDETTKHVLQVRILKE